MSSGTKLNLLERSMKLESEVVVDDAVAFAILACFRVLYEASMITRSLISAKTFHCHPRAYAIDPQEPHRLTGISEGMNRPGAQSHLPEGRSVPTWR